MTARTLVHPNEYGKAIGVIQRLASGRVAPTRELISDLKALSCIEDADLDGCWLGRVRTDVVGKAHGVLVGWRCPKRMATDLGEAVRLLSNLKSKLEQLNTAAVAA